MADFHQPARSTDRPAGYMASLHTIICNSDCSLKHNDLVLALQESMNRADGGSFDGGKGKTAWESQRRSLDFKRCLDRLLENNWNRNSDVPEPLDKLRYPLVHVCCLLGKPKALEFLINNRDFDPAVQCTRTGETALHVTLRFFYGIFRPPRSQMEALSRKPHRLGNNECVAMFEKLLSILTSQTDRILHVKDSISRESVFHLAATNRTEASRELLMFKKKEGAFKRGQGDNMRELKFENERNFYDQCLRLLAAKLDDNAGLEVLRFDTNRRNQTVLDILAKDQSASALDTLQFLAKKFPALHAVLRGCGNFLIQPPVKHSDNEGTSSRAGTSRETCDDQEPQEFPSQHSDPPVSSSPEVGPPVAQGSQPEDSHRVDLHDGVMIKIEYDSEPDGCAGALQPVPHSGKLCARQSSHSTLRDLLSQRGVAVSSSSCPAPAVSDSTLATYAASLNTTPSIGFASQYLNCERSEPSAGVQDTSTTCSASVLSPFLELVIKEGIELDETTHNSIMSAIKRKCSQKLAEIDSKMSAISEQSVSNEEEINERFFLVQRKKAQMDEVRNEIVVINRQIATLQNEMERKVEMGKMLQLEVHQLEQEMNKTKEFGGALELKRKQLSEEQHQIQEKLSLCRGTRQGFFGPPQKKPKPEL